MGNRRRSYNDVHEKLKNQHLKEGKTASAAVQQAMKSLRESEKFSEIWHWAPFQLMGDDVKIEFKADDDVKTNSYLCFVKVITSVIGFSITTTLTTFRY